MINYNNFNIIAAVDILGGFSKDGKIPWHYSADFKWFKEVTNGKVCIMGRHTYEDLLERAKQRRIKQLNVSEEGYNFSKDSDFQLLPGRRCFVVSSRIFDHHHLQNIIVIRNIWDIEKYIDSTTEVFLIGGERIFKEGISAANKVYLTVINKEYDCDKYFPTTYLLKHFIEQNVYKVDNEPDLRFIIWKRNKNEINRP